MERIICPLCLGMFRTVYQENKQERCPYCGQMICHSARLLQWAKHTQSMGSHPSDFHQWVLSHLDVVSTWWAERDANNMDNLDVLASRLEHICRGITEWRRRIQDKDE